MVLALRHSADAATANTMCRRASVRYGCSSTGPPVERLDGDFGEREEVALGGVEHVGDAAAVAVAGERERALDPVALGLDPDALLAVFDVRRVLFGGGLGDARGIIAAAPAGSSRLSVTA